MSLFMFIAGSILAGCLIGVGVSAYREGNKEAACAWAICSVAFLSMSMRHLLNFLKSS